ncbi:uncharacterized protein HMPREF1541_02774 [Cyphellophora europaea CBS 101466]|uniref:O-methyltransferase C-terminal domain-containing protein n=1 Tax=Cyphellophora europaea (strain CBS 101466) TaxID=1220924 RepID=W2S4T7_CYPE1|nr:uncharacterized protein HMPREF1541_02774 [Cyphellophora europaea CBS 101466]ETN43615.1 hypothetical protein HMPREF1541_02774 [Cyphellophora europaea CBS 101466]
MQGRIINQDLPTVVANTIEHPGVEQCPHDFFTEQPIKGAQVYYMRNVVHDWGNVKALRILKNIVPAMTEGSDIWLDEFVVPDVGAIELQVNWDMTMLVSVNTTERSRTQWQRLLAEAGLSIKKIMEYNPGSGESMIRAVPAATVHSWLVTL